MAVDTVEGQREHAGADQDEHHEGGELGGRFGGLAGQVEGQPALHQREQHGAEYARLNPKNKVPTLLIDGEPLTENVAILSWIARSYADRKLLPADPKNSIRALSLMAWIASGIHPLLPRLAAPTR